MKINPKRFINLALVSVGFCGFSNLSEAALLSWESIHTGNPLDFLYESSSRSSSSNLTYSNTWNLLTQGYSANSSIDGITVWFKFADDDPGNFEGAESSDGGDVAEHVDISLGGSKIWDNQEVDGRHPAVTYTSYSMMLDPILHASVFTDLMTDGKLGYSVELQRLVSSSHGREDTYLKEAGIRATFEKTPKNRVPDGGTSFTLLALSLAGIAGLRKKLV